MSNESVALYRKYRPSSFAEVKDQEHIVSVLEGAIKKESIPHAMLFCGGRGTGKTTLARIFAKEIGTSDVDLYEIDAASNRGIDDVRELREAVHTVPYESTFKVYIIDEVHMLTKEAFNALLKTLEEPPAHVIFILATTEKDKLLDTITSRCQVFNFRNPSRQVLRQTVQEIAKKEGFTLVDAAADLIALAADGSFRDALGVTQKVILASGDTIGSTDEVAAIIGAPTTDVLRTLLDSLHTKDVTVGLTAVQTAVGNHVDLKLFTRLLLERVRMVMLLRNAPAVGEELITQLPDTDQEQVRALAADTASPINSHLLLQLLEVTEQVGRASVPAVPLEVALVTYCQQ